MKVDGREKVRFIGRYFDSKTTGANSPDCKTINFRHIQQNRTSRAQGTWWFTFGLTSTDGFFSTVANLGSIRMLLL